MNNLISFRLESIGNALLTLSLKGGMVVVVMVVVVVVVVVELKLVW